MIAFLRRAWFLHRMRQLRKHLEFLDHHAQAIEYDRMATCDRIAHLRGALCDLDNPIAVDGCAPF